MGQFKVVRKMSGLTRALLGARTPTPPGLRRRSADRAVSNAVPVHVKRLSAKVGEEDADDVIDLGAPRLRRPAAPRPRRCFYTPNPRLYPGPERKIKLAATVQRRRGRVYRRAAPNPRLYRPAVRAPPPPARPRAAWPAPAPARALDTASGAALRLALARPAPPPPKPTKASGRSRRVARRLPSPARAPPRGRRVPSPRPRRLVVTLPAGAAYRPVSEHFRARAAPAPGAASPTAARVMDYRSSPDDASDGNDSLSAPSEFLAEFLSAIMQRQYAEALKYCRLILQYEPHNATARGFYPLLRQKLARHQLDSEPSSGSIEDPVTVPQAQHEAMEQSSGSASPRSRRSSSGSAAADSLETDSEPADSPSGSGWDTPHSARDDNGNNLPPTHTSVCDADNSSPHAAPSPRPPRAALSQSEESAASLRRLRAQFACSIK